MFSYRAGNENRTHILGMANRCTNRCAIPAKFERVVGFEPTVIPDWKSGAIDHYATLARNRKLNFKSFGLLELNQF